MKRLVVVFAALVLSGGGSATQSGVHPLGQGPLEPGRSVSATVPLGSGTSITQSVVPNSIVAGTSVGCVPFPVFDHGWWRLFDLNVDHDLAGDFCAENIDFAVESAIGPIQDITVNVYCLDDGLPFETAFLDLVGTATIPQPDAQLEFFNIALPPGTCCDAASQDMAVEIHSDDCQETGTCDQFFVGMNDLGQTAPTYISSEDCGVAEPVDVALLGFPASHLIMVVNGTGDSVGVPASTAVGMWVTALLLLGTGGCIVLRRVIDS